jgi:hypothetical protein
VLVAGLVGGLIGWAFIELQSDSTTAAAIGALVGAVAAALGVAIVAVLVLRALGEWRQLSTGTDRRDDSARHNAV